MIDDNRYFKTEIVDGKVKIVPKEFGKPKMSMEEREVLRAVLSKALDAFRISPLVMFDYSRDE